MVGVDQGLQSIGALHPGKANVVADALSKKSHCNSLVSENFHLSHLLHPMVLHNIAMDCSLRSQIIEL
jgi:hypothetical protein